MNKKTDFFIIGIVLVSQILGCQSGFKSPVDSLDAYLGEMDQNGTSTEVKLYLPYPNPTMGTIYFQYEIPGQTWVHLAIENLVGDEIKVLVNQNTSAGVHEVIWDLMNSNGNKVDPGLYIAHLTTGDGASEMQLFRYRDRVKDDP